MKSTVIAILLAVALKPGCVLAQLPAVPTASSNVVQAIAPNDGNYKFDLNFPGGNPDALVAAIEKASGRPLNAIVPQDCKEIQIPPLKMSGVTVQDLFKALQMASVKRIKYVTGYNYGMPGQNEMYSTYESSYGFQSASGRDKADGNAVWYFQVSRPPDSEQPKELCRFYQLEPLLMRYSIEDITTAIRTGWEMLHVSKTPQLKFHPETKLLIAVGTEPNLKLIENVIEQLRGGTPEPQQPKKASPLREGKETDAKPK